MQKGEIWWVNLNPTKGSEQNGKRPVAIVSGNLLNKYAPVIYVCPLTTKIKNYKGDVILKPNNINGLKEESEILIMHLRSISKDRFETKIGQISIEQLYKLREGIKDLLIMD
ncbi:MAG: type II toxin-antitoxin system PemK/MazF family toxin [Bacteroidetes bacterium]|nr:type II toxin-antitoxin system PemK/MazF family toxin [Bacteroidota bacterium]MCB0803617.1 type II toxin-antitoxin system PemK/MazF family toxin [Flavobacteriales bacterium]NOG58009.1 type II toxin-antitoxin system PemK/MazF family toxin [Bacteroidota bacterium]